MNRSQRSGESEFAFIHRRLAPLAAGAPGALRLEDDAAFLVHRPGYDTVIAADMLIAGRHFPIDAPMDLAGRKALRANLSDLAAMGAEPAAYLLSMAWPSGIDSDDRDLLIDGLAADQAHYGLHLLGGDTTSGAGPLVIAITAIGSTPEGEAVLRSSAEPGDLVAVTGEIGDAALALDLIEGRAQADEAVERALRARYFTPEPRLAAAGALRRHASAAIDVSDGLVADAAHLGEASGVQLSLELERVPVSAHAQAWIGRQPDPRAAMARLAAGGDDYELVCTVPPDELAAFEAACAAIKLRLTVIGSVTASEPAGAVCTWEGAPFEPGTPGFTHF